VSGIRRRELVILLLGGGVAAAGPLVARAQQTAIPVVGYLDLGSSEASTKFAAAFRQGLSETGYVEGRNVTIEYRWADGQYDRLPTLAADLVRRQVTVIAACGTSAPGLASKAATSAIPIVFQTGGDPVQDGLVASMNRPGRNVTGVSRMSVALEPKRLELLREFVPKASVIALLVNPTNPRSELVVHQLQEPAGALGIRLHVLKAITESELDSVFESLVQLGAGALLVTQEPSYRRIRTQIITLASRHVIPTMYSTRDYAVLGGLVSYDASPTDSYRQVGIYAGRILKGEKPADLPVQQPTKFELAINVKTAKALGLEIPPTLLARADEVIE
jgi:putative tryptophan/tyrosine transport system substrate-binding protein